MLFTLADLHTKVMQDQWSGKIQFYPSNLMLDSTVLINHRHTLMGELAAKSLTIGFGEPVLVTDEPTPQTLANILYLWHKGAVVVPVRHTLSAQARDAIAADCQAKLCLHNQQVIPLGQDNLASLNANSKSKFKVHSERRVSGADLALIIYTSGSTGKPKGIMLSHHNVMSAMYSIANYLELDRQEHILCLSPLSFDYGLYQVLFSLAFDCELTLFEGGFHPLKVLKALETNRISLLPVVPAMASALAKMIQAFKKPLPHLLKMTNTGGHLAEDNIRLFHALLPKLNIYAMYGLTECKRALYLPPEDSLRKLGSVGIPMPGLEAKIFTTNKETQHFEEVALGEIGELFIRGSSLMQGYFGLGNGGACIVEGQYRDDNWLATGDLFCQDQDGYFYFKGRSKDLIKQAGFCLYPAELEAQIEQHENVFLCAIVPHKDKWGDEIACLNVQLIEASSEKQQAFSAWLADQLDANYRPRQLVFIDSMALTQNAKVDKQSLMANLAANTL